MYSKGSSYYNNKMKMQPSASGLEWISRPPMLSMMGEECPFRDKDWIKSFIKFMFRLWFWLDLLMLIVGFSLILGIYYFRPEREERCTSSPTSVGSINDYTMSCSYSKDSVYWLPSILLLVLHVMCQLIRYRFKWEGDGKNGNHLIFASTATVIIFTISFMLCFLGYNSRYFLFFPLFSCGFNFHHFIFLQFVMRRDEVFELSPLRYRNFMNPKKIPSEADLGSLSEVSTCAKGSRSQTT